MSLAVHSYLEDDGRGERCAIAAHIETLNDLFAALFRPAEGEAPVIRQPLRPLREDLFALFFPEALVRMYADKSKSNLTWFFNSDARNKSVRRSLIALLREDPRAVVSEAHRKSHEALWPTPGQAAFDAPGLLAALRRCAVPGALDVRWHVTSAPEGETCRLERFFQVDEAAALARMILTLAVGGDAPAEAAGELWRDDAGGDCDFMRRDDSVSGGIRYCRMLDLQGRHERAFEGFERLAGRLDGPARTMDESTLYCRLGEMRFTGEGCARDEREALRYDQLGCLDENPKSWFQLGQHASGTPARQAVERAAELGYGPAILQLGEAWMNGSARLACVRNPEAARRCFQRGLTLPGAEGARCAFMLGRLYEGQNDREAAVNAYRVAQEGGSAEAAERLARLDWVLPPEGERTDARPGAATTGYCLTNGLDGCNRLYLEGLRGRWDITVCGAEPGAVLPKNARARDCSPEIALRELSAGVFWGGAPQFPELTIALLSPDWKRNLANAAALLGELARLANSLGERAWDLADAVRIYVLASHDDAALALDAAFAGMGALYFPLRLCDPALDAADRLFSAAPLFLPRLRAPEDTPVRLKIIGSGDVALAVLRRAVALPLPEAAGFSMDVYGADATAMGRRFLQLCPGFRGADAALRGPMPGFHDCTPEEGLLDALDGDLAGGNYFVVAAGDDGLNLRLGTLLRGELMRRDPAGDRQPFIAVHTRHPVLQWLAGSLPAGPEGGQSAQTALWHSQYDLFAFGALDMYAPGALEGDALERRARQAHMLFLGLPNTRDARHAAMAGYYKRQLNRDTARLEALSLVYRMNLAGLNLPGWRLYGVPEEEARLGAEYTRWLKEEGHLQQAVRDEHARRSRMLLSLGWSPATPEQVTAYVGRGNPGHRLYPARLDPFICPWEALEDGELLRRVRDAVRARFPEKSVPDPRRDEEASVRDTERLLDGN